MWTFSNFRFLLIRNRTKKSNLSQVSFMIYCYCFDAFKPSTSRPLDVIYEYEIVYQKIGDVDPNTFEEFLELEEYRSRTADRRPYVTLACEREGAVKKTPKPVVDDEDEEVPIKRFSFPNFFYLHFIISLLLCIFPPIKCQNLTIATMSNCKLTCKSNCQQVPSPYYNPHRSISRERSKRIAGNSVPNVFILLDHEKSFSSKKTSKKMEFLSSNKQRCRWLIYPRMSKKVSSPSLHICLEATRKQNMAFA
ncbi:hypothetical protein M9H77_06942 [Catharanthus roseus]|uniref:Uncharacterized protein n=1 Tax=Catharanthus roseus TaxID=4058 RepID=A0ACC0BTS4_CATRO|nr:hypothetical protein M9H77_06942 [Catharanthus roseus]